MYTIDLVGRRQGGKLVPSPVSVFFPSEFRPNAHRFSFVRFVFAPFGRRLSWPSSAPVTARSEPQHITGTSSPTRPRHSAYDLIIVVLIKDLIHAITVRIRGAMVARLTPDQKVACSIHVGFKPPNKPDSFLFFALFFFLLFFPHHFSSTK